MDILEKELFELKNENYELPDSVLNKINLAFDEIRNEGQDDMKEDKIMKINNSKFKSHKKIIGTAAAFTIITGLAFAPPVKATIKNLIFNFQNKGIETAVQNDYVQKVSHANFTTDDFDINLTNVLCDPSKIALDFEVSFDESFDISLAKLKNSSVNFDICISDENNNILLKDGVASSISSLQYIIDDTNIKNNKLNIQLLMNSSDANIQSTSKFKIEIPKLTFRKNESPDIIYSKDINWDFSLDISEKFTSSKPVDYKFVNDCPNIIVKKAQSLPTGMLVDFDYLPTGHYENLVIYSTLVDSEGNEYHLTDGATMDVASGGVGDNISGIFTGLTSFDNPESFTLRIQNPDRVTFDEVHFTK